MYLCQHDFHILIYPLCIVNWKHGFRGVAQCVCSSQCTPCLECVHASIHTYMSIQFPIIAQPPMHSYMETWVPLCGTVCVSQSPHFWSHTLFRMCVCMSTCIYVHLTPNVTSNHYAYIHRNMGAPVWQCVCVSVTSFLFLHLGYNVYMHQYMYLYQPEFHILLHPLCIVTWKHGFPCVALCLFSSHYLCPYTLFRMCTCIRTCNYVHLTSHVS